MPLGRLLSVAGRAAASLPHVDAAAALLRAGRRPFGRVGAGCVDVAVRGVHRAATRAAADRLEAELEGQPGVLGAEVNAVLGRVLLRYDADVMPEEGLLPAVEAAEQAAGLTAEPLPEGPHPGDRDAVLRELALAAVGLAGVGGALIGRALRLPPLPVAAVTLVTVAEAAPPLRLLRTSPAGRAVTDAVLGASSVVTRTWAQVPTTLLADAVHRLSRAAAARAQRDAWNRFAADLGDRPSSYRASPLAVGARPTKIPRGPVEAYADTAFPAAVASSLVMAGLTASRGRAMGALAAASGRSAALGREAFLAQLSRVLAGHDVVVMDPGALAVLDRVDVVVLDSSVLLTGDRVVEEVLPLGTGVPADELLLHALTLADLGDPTAAHRRGPWSVHASQPGAPLPDAAGEKAREWTDAGEIVCVLSHEGEAQALVRIVDELDPYAEALAHIAARHATVVVAENGEGVASRLGVEQVTGGGPELTASVRALQQQGRTVALVAAQDGAALAAADLGVAVPRGAAAVPWGAHVICLHGPPGAHLVLEALPLARKASRRSVTVSAGAAVTAVLLSSLGSGRVAERRALGALGMASVANLAVGTWYALPLAGRPPPVPAERTPWHAMPPDAALRLLGSTLDGLADAEVARRLLDGSDVAAPNEGLARASAEELANPVSAALAVSAGMSATLGSALDAVLITGVLAVNALIGGAQRIGTTRALRHLVDASAVRVHLHRGGHTADVTADRLVAGDVVELQAGDAVPADCRILSASGLEVDESSLTGESQPVVKTAAATPAAAVADRACMLYEGTSVAAGTARAVVVATGSRTQIGRTIQAAAHAPAADGVEARLHALVRVTLPVSVAAGLALLVLTLLRGRRLGPALGPAVNLAVAAIPEGLPFVATIAELAAARRLSSRGALVRHPSTMEALGRVDVLCFDKTGTLTQGRISLRLVADATQEHHVEQLPAQLASVVAAAVRASPQDDDAPGRLPHPTDRAVLAGAQELGIGTVGDLGSWRRLDEQPFEPGRGYHAVLGEHPSGLLLSVKGAPEVVLRRCTSVAGPPGHPRPIDDAGRRQLAERADRLARGGYRVLAVAERPVRARRGLDESQIEELQLVGFLGLADAVRPTAAAAVDGLRASGVDVVMVTGDHPGTAEAIAGELDALRGRRVLTGPELDALDDEALAEVLPDVAVFARVTPQQKGRIVEGLQRAGRTVAVTGDGANDAAAIRTANIGIALGHNATPAARDAADIVVTDDRIETIVAAILEGRAMWASVRDALAILLGGNLGEIAFTIGTVLVGGDKGLTTRQLLLINMLTDALPASAVALRPPPDRSPELLAAEGPQASLAGALTRQIALRAAATAAAATGAWVVARMTGTPSRARTVGLVALVSAQLLQTLAMGYRSPLVVGSVVASLLALAVIVSVPGLSAFFGCRPIGPVGWGIALTAAAVAAAVAAVLPPLRRLATPCSPG